MIDKMNRDRKKILMLLENPFPIDPRPRSEAGALLEAGYDVSIIAVRFPDEKLTEVVDGVNVYRVPQFSLFKKGSRSRFRLFRMIYGIFSKAAYIFEYVYFTSACFFISLYLAVRHGFDVIHAHNPPNTLFLIGVFYKLFGKKYVFDHHDLSPELFLSRYNIDKNFIYDMLMLEEKFTLKAADMVIATNDSYKEIEVTRANIDPDKIFVVRNGPNLDKFKLQPPDAELQKKAGTILAYCGVMGPQDGVDYLLRALRLVIDKFGRDDFYCVIIGLGDAVDELKKLTHELRLEDHVWFTGFISFEDLLRYLSTADICLDPNPSSPLNDSSTWIKVMEYMALGKPLVSFDLKETRFSAQEAALYATPNEEEEFAKAIVTLMDDPELRKKMGEFGRKRVRNELSWQHVSKNLLRAYDWLFDEAFENASQKEHANTDRTQMRRRPVEIR